MEYTAVCIGGSADGSLISSDSSCVHIPVREKFTAMLHAADVPISYKPQKVETYRTERFSYGDGKRPEVVLVEESLSLRQAFGMLLDAYTGSHIPANSERKAEPSEVDALAAKIKFLGVVIQSQSAIIRDLRSKSEI